MQKHKPRPITPMRKARLMADLSMIELSDKAGVSINTVLNAECGGNVTIWNLVAIADVLKVGLDEYIGREVPRKWGQKR